MMEFKVNNSSTFLTAPTPQGYILRTTGDTPLPLEITLLLFILKHTASTIPEPLDRLDFL
jgi:hypothetical protein